MVYTCFLCKWRSDESPRRSYHRFPSDGYMKQKWLNIIGRSEACIGQLTSLCGVHFEKDCFLHELVNGRITLKNDSLPTLHLGNIRNENQNRWSYIHGLSSESSRESGTADEQRKDSTCESNIEDSSDCMNPATSEIHVREHFVGFPKSCPPSEPPTHSSDGQLAKAEILRLKKEVLISKRSVNLLRNSKRRIESRVEKLKKMIKNCEEQISNLQQLENGRRKQENNGNVHK